ILVALQQSERISQRLVAIFVVMAVGFAVGSHVHELRLRSLFEAAFEPPGKVFTRVEQAFKRNRPRQRTVVKEDYNRRTGWKADQIWPRSIDGSVGCVGPDRGAFSKRLCIFGADRNFFQ